MLIELILAAALSGGAQDATEEPSAAQLVLPGATASPDCGGLFGLAGRAFCVTAPLGTIDALSEAYVKDLAAKGWLAADGSQNRVVFVKRRPGGGCAGVQMLAFYDTSKPATPESPGYLALAVVPGDLCAPAASPAPAAEPAQPAQPTPQ